jgi:magnesium chelatase family protein
VLAKVTSCAVIGLDGELVEVEVDISSGLPASKLDGKVFPPCVGAPE